ncbi:MAG: methionine--tRNA ligase [Oscillospiraceae bacterium]|nr:methionine--tRNA ligase [Oscillospiraceae bacterium]MDD4414402.1 methionine--tRNA ligase [Oscillospiraceae bacterium]
MKKEKFYITTAIAYTSHKPHIGNTYDPVLADTIARYKRMMGFDVFFLTGSDEHGQKIEECANAHGLNPKEYVDVVAAEIKSVWDCMNTGYDRFIRTTDPDHEMVIKKIFKKLYDQGDIYKGVYQGKYCVPCEAFFTSSQLKDGKCPDCGREVTDASEEAYFLRLGKYQDRLMEYYNSNPDFFKPDSRRAEMVNNFLKPGLSDLCVSRTSFKWGIPVEFDPKHVTYVWLDALSNYITGIGYDPDGSSPLFHKYWPADLHVIGKDIVRFHTIYWPIILMALDLPLPKQVLGHPWVLVGDDKMSKSKGNVLYADDLARHFGVDAVRYYLLSEIPFAQDGTITYESLIAKYNSDLANTLGNLVNRSITMANKYFEGRVTKPEAPADSDKDLISAADETVKNYIRFMDAYHTAEAADTVMEFARRCNKYIDETTPWILAKSDDTLPRLNQVLYNLIEGIRILGILLKPFMPSTAENILGQINAPEDKTTMDSVTAGFGKVDGYTVGTPVPLFARIEAEKLLKDIAAETADEGEQQSKPENVAFLDTIGIEDFAKVDLRVARIIDCEPIKKAKKLLKLTLDDGSATPRTVCSGIAQWYQPAELKGRSVILVANLKPAVLCGVESQGMILAADDGEDVRVIFTDEIAPGSKVR